MFLAIGGRDGGRKDDAIRDRDVALVAVDAGRAALPAMAHLAIADRRHAFFRHAGADSHVSTISVGLGVLRYKAPQKL